MRAVIQRVSSASVTVNGGAPRPIGPGLAILLGVKDGEDTAIIPKLAAKCANLRIFEDENGKTNLNLESVGGSLLLISQFTLYADCKRGNRPGFTDAGAPDLAEELYEYIISECRKSVPVVERGVFGADMKVSLVNDGPFTVILDSEKL